ncbi:hypothetical protein ACFQZ4_36930 [Catellatospora coxensis]|uniref:hypothetical protein n=1 Tax=Catellatospora coxensis TaxID=310354 RepID=UPI0019420C5F|nr:hypothetical protein [Catellatospora coxensis]
MDTDGPRLRSVSDSDLAEVAASGVVGGVARQVATRRWRAALRTRRPTVLKGRTMYLLFGKWYLCYLAVLGLGALGGLVVLVRILVEGSRTDATVPADQGRDEAVDSEADQ